MTKATAVVLAVIALAAVGCDDKKGDGGKPAASAAATAKPAPAPAKSGSPGGGW